MDKNKNRNGEYVNVLYYDNYNKSYEEYYKDGKYHRENGPAKAWYFPDGEIMCEEYYLCGDLHREDEPAKILYYDNGKIEYEE